MGRDKDFGFAAAMSGDQAQDAAPAIPKVDLSGFDDEPTPTRVDREAAEVAREVSQERGFTRRTGPRPRTAAKAAPRPEKPASRRQRVRMAEVVAPEPEARADEDRAQLNINAPVSVVRRFKERERRLGIRAWQALEALLDLADAAEAKSQ